MEKLPPIPIPAAQKWREFRLKRLPAIVFVVLVFATFWCWRLVVTPHHLVGEMALNQTSVSSPQAGIIGQLNVVPLQSVTAGETVAEIITTSPEILEASLAVIRAEIELIRSGMEPPSNERRTALDYEQLRLDWMNQRVDLAARRVNLTRAENEVRRNQGLVASGIVSKDLFEDLEAARDALLAEIQMQEELVDQIERSLNSLSLSDGSADAGEPSNSMRAAIRVQEENLRLREAQLKPLVLKAPINGQVSLVHRTYGEAIVAGEPIVTITADSSSHILAFLSQPLPLEPREGMEVEVRSRSNQRLVGQGRVLRIGTHLQPILDSPRRNSAAPSPKALPVLVSVPVGFATRPGELVDLRFIP